MKPGALVGTAMGEGEEPEAGADSAAQEGAHLMGQIVLGERLGEERLARLQETSLEYL